MSYILKKRELIEIETRQRCAQITLWGERKHSNWDNLVNVLCGLYQRTDRLQQVCIPTFVFACRATFLLVLGGLHSCLFEAFRKKKGSLRLEKFWRAMVAMGRCAGQCPLRHGGSVLRVKHGHIRGAPKRRRPCASLLLHGSWS